MKKFFFFIFLFVSLICNAEQIGDIKGKHIMFTPFSFSKGSGLELFSSYSPIVYSPDVLKKGKFDDKFLSQNQTIFGIPLYIKDYFVFNEGKKDESIAIISNRDGEDIVIYLPLRYKRKTKPLSSLWYPKETKDGAENFTKLRNVDIPIYNASLIDSLESKFKGQIIYPLKAEGYIHVEQSDRWYRSRNVIIAGTPYVFDGFYFDMPFGSIIYLTAHLTDAHGNLFTLPIEMLNPYLYNNTNRGQSKNTPTLENFSDFFVTEDSLLSLIKSSYDQSIFDHINKYIGKEVYLPKNNYVGYELRSDGKRNQHSFNSSDYYTLSDVLILPNIKRTSPYYNYYAILNISNNSYAFPLTDQSHLLFIDGAIRREQERISNEERQRAREERERAEQQEELQYKNSLIKKYGRANADLILDGCVKLGFTKAMCEEAWGEPYDVTRVTTQFGSAEAWWYGNGNILYFQGNKLVIIQD